MSGFPADSDKTVVVEPDRRRAIQQIISDAQNGDVVLLAGKGHENYQIVGTTRHPFDDVEEAQAAIEGRESVPAR
jgi:UDP-N-acetylmuramoyl-L-alanyl-D-glutamate--2,6-diaminopimelate ligase